MAAPPATHIDNLKGRAVRGTAAVFVSQALHFSLNVAVAVILARVLSPEDFGVFAIAFAVIGFLEFAKYRRDGRTGDSESDDQPQPARYPLLVQHWGRISVAMCACLIAPAFGYSTAIADSRLITALALTFILGGLSTQHVALLRRTLRFTTLAVCEAAALAIASAVGISRPCTGAYWSLVYLSITREAMLLTLSVIATRWIPRWPRRWANIAPLVRFGGLMMAFDVMGYLTFKLDNLIVGWYLGAAVLGFYDKAYQFLLMPVTQITLPLSNVVHATLSRLQTEPERFRAYLDRALLLATSLGMPLTAFLYGNAATIIEQCSARDGAVAPDLPGARAGRVRHDDYLVRRLDFSRPRPGQAPVAVDGSSDRRDSVRISGGSALGRRRCRRGVQHRAGGAAGTDAALHVCRHA